MVNTTAASPAASNEFAIALTVSAVPEASFVAVLNTPLKLFFKLGITFVNSSNCASPLVIAINDCNLIKIGIKSSPAPPNKPIAPCAAWKPPTSPPANLVVLPIISPKSAEEFLNAAILSFCSFIALESFIKVELYSCVPSFNPSNSNLRLLISLRKPTWALTACELSTLVTIVTSCIIIVF